MLPELDEKVVRERIAKRIALEFEDGEVVNLGIGIPTLVSDYIPEGKRVIFQAENGAIGTGPPPETPNYKCIGAGGRLITLLPGGSYFSSDTSFGLIRGGHGDREPEWTCGVLYHPICQALIIILFGGAALYAVLQAMGVLPAGW